MEIKTAHNEVASTGIDRVSNFEIAKTGMMFKILSSGLYQNKIAAVIRELSCNAYDAHVEAGRADMPFDLHLPTPFEPYFEIRDHGVGLDDDGVMKLYQTYFASTKSKDNNNIGGFGLGSKSPFAYTDGFSIKAVYDGVTRQYSAFLNEEGFPAVAFLNEEPTPNEHNGLAVSFPVSHSDIHNFRNTAQVVLEFFDPKPNVNMVLDYNKTEYIVQTDTWGIRAGASPQTSSVRAVMGRVPYALAKFDTTLLDPKHDVLFGLPLDLFFEIGDLEPNPSRETISLTKETITNIVDRFNDIIDSSRKEMVSHIDKFATLWDAVSFVNSNEMEFAQNSKFFHKIVGGNKALFGKYTNFEFTSLQVEFDRSLYVPHLEVFSFDSLYGSKFERGHLLYPEHDGYTDKTPKVYRMAPITPTKTTEVWFNDVPTGGLSYFNRYVKDLAKGAKCILIHPRLADRKADQTPFLELAKKLCKEIGGAKLRLVSEIYTKTVRAPREKKDGKSVIADLTGIGIFREYNSDSWTGVTMNLDATAEADLRKSITDSTNRYYIPTSFGSALYPEQYPYIRRDRKDTIHHTKCMVTAGRVLGVLPKDCKIYFVKGNDQRLKKEAGWINVIDLMLDPTNLDKAQKLSLAEARIATLDSALANLNTLKETFITNAAKIKDKRIRAVFTVYKKMKTQGTNSGINDVIYFYRCIAKDDYYKAKAAVEKKVFSKSGIAKLKDYVVAKYPMLQYVIRSYTTVNASEVLAYMDLCSGN